MGSRWSQSGHLAWDDNGAVAMRAKAYFYRANTTTPQAVYSDAAESSAHTHPVVADGNGRWPLVFIPFSDSGFDEKVTTSGGTQLYYYQGIPNADPVEAASASVTAADLWQTGMPFWRPVGGTLDGFVRANGRTIGSAASGATERANADTEDLFVHYWNGLANDQAAVSGGRGGSAAADYAANKTITLPDLRGSMPIGIDDMGNSAAGRFSNVSFSSGTATTAGSVCGTNTVTISTAQLPAHTHGISLTSGSGGSHTHTGTASTTGSHSHSGTTGNDSPDHTHAFTADVSGGTGATATAGAGVTVDDPSVSATGGASTPHTHAFTTSSDGSHTHTISISTESAHTHSVTGTSSATGSGSATPIVSRAMLGTWYIRL